MSSSVVWKCPNQSPDTLWDTPWTGWPRKREFFFWGLQYIPIKCWCCISIVISCRTLDWYNWNNIDIVMHLLLYFAFKMYRYSWLKYRYCGTIWVFLRYIVDTAGSNVDTEMDHNFLCTLLITRILILWHSIVSLSIQNWYSQIKYWYCDLSPRHLSLHWIVFFVLQEVINIAGHWIIIVIIFCDTRATRSNQISILWHITCSSGLFQMLLSSHALLRSPFMEISKSVKCTTKNNTRACCLEVHTTCFA